MCLKSNMFRFTNVCTEITTSAGVDVIYLLDLLIRPMNEEFVIVVRLLGHASREVNGNVAQIHALPVSVEENAQLLRTSEGKHWN